MYELGKRILGIQFVDPCTLQGGVALQYHRHGGMLRWDIFG
jgi:hypothetical protein